MNKINFLDRGECKVIEKIKVANEHGKKIQPISNERKPIKLPAFCCLPLFLKIKNNQTALSYTVIGSVPGFKLSQKLICNTYHEHLKSPNSS